MKRKVLLKEIAKLGAILKRHGGGHDIYAKGNKSISVPRHAEVKENVAQNIIKFFSSMS